ncbi:chorismate-binding protein [Maribacter sp. MMG018]|nr:chorismate-binding protein [Maribacter sp. MMG018]
MVPTIFKQAERHLREQLPFVLYRKPKTAVLNGLFQNDDKIHTIKDFKESGFVFAPFDDKAPSILLYPDNYVTEPLALKETSKDHVSFSNPIDGIEKSEYKNMVKRAVAGIESGEYRKVVLSRKKEVSIIKSAIAIFKELVQLYENALCYVWYHPRIGTWLGATPEILLKTRGTAFTTMSLAGTKLINGIDNKPIWEEKELHEQRLVTEFIESVLKEKSLKMEVGELETVRAGHLWHLRTKISGEYERNKIGELITALHPTPAVCGFPKAEAKEFILQNESYTRSYYTGFLGELNFKNERSRNTNNRNKENSAYRSITTCSELYVNLRCMQIVDNKAIVYVGGGITFDSDAENEWEETENKSLTMLKAVMT